MYLLGTNLSKDQHTVATAHQQKRKLQFWLDMQVCMQPHSAERLVRASLDLCIVQIMVHLLLPASW